MEANKDDALKCLKKAKELFHQRDLAGARRLANKSKKMYSTPECDEFINHLTNTATDTPINDSTHNNSRSPRNKKSTEEAEQCEPPKKSYTPQQQELVNKILKCKDYYETLGVDKDASEDDLKKSYKKLALKLHPDKNNAPKADDAFKAVSRAYEVLNDESKRRQYDQFGEDGISNNHSGMGTYYRRRGFDEFDLFREMFGENPFNDNFGETVYYSPSGQTFVFRQPFRNFTARTPQHAQSPFFLILFFIPVFLLFVSFIFMPPSPYSLYRTSSYTLKKEFIKGGETFEYYVMTTFDQDYPKNSQKSEIERMAAKDLTERLWERCSQEIFFRSRAKKLPKSCERYEKLSGRRVRTR